MLLLYFNSQHITNILFVENTLENTSTITHVVQCLSPDFYTFRHPSYVEAGQLFPSLDAGVHRAPLQVRDCHIIFIVVVCVIPRLPQISYIQLRVLVALSGDSALDASMEVVATGDIQRVNTKQRAHPRGSRTTDAMDITDMCIFPIYYMIILRQLLKVFSIDPFHACQPC